jgi:hypothetical protein
LWHCGAYSSQGLIWRLDDGFAGTPPDVEIALIPLVQPVVIPANGGSFSFFAFATNNDSIPAGVSVWTKWRNPNGTYSAPVIGPRAVTLPAGTTGWFRNQSMAGTMPAGTYLYLGYLGSGTTVYDSSYFTVTKSITTDNGPYVWDQTCTGDPLPGEVSVAAPSTFIVAGAYPNPFNPTTTLSFTLPERSHVSLNIYNLSGGQVTQLINGMRDAGTHQVTFDGSNLASGVYLYNLKASGQFVAGKMLLLK